MHVVGNVLTCGMNNIYAGLLVVQGISLPEGMELWKILEKKLQIHLYPIETHAMVPSKDVLLLCGSRFNVAEKDDDREAYCHVGVRLAFLTFDPAQFDSVQQVEAEVKCQKERSQQSHLF